MLKLENQPPLILTIGNDLRGDDGVGPYIAKQLQVKLPKLKVIDTGENPENYLEEIIALKPKNILIIDAADFGGKHGETRIIPEDKIESATVSTHQFPIAALAKLIQQDTGASVQFLGIQPKHVNLGAAISAQVTDAADKLVIALEQAYA